MFVLAASSERGRWRELGPAAGGHQIKLSYPKDRRPFEQGERVYVSAVKVDADEIEFELHWTAGELTEDGHSHSKASLAIRFPDGVLAKLPAADVLQVTRRALIADQERGGSAARTVKPGQSEAEVRELLGEPQTVVDLGPKRILMYERLRVTLLDGAVADIE